LVFQAAFPEGVAMAPLFVLVTSILVFRLAGLAGVKAFASWREATRTGLFVMFVFTGSTHFSSLKHDYAAMVPPPLTGQLWVIYLTGVLEILGAVGLLVPRLRKTAGVSLCLLLLVLFPANAYASFQDIQFRGAPPTDLWLRALVQAIFLLATWWGAVATRRVHPAQLDSAA
jgi:uncharacterized membrane protein